MLYGAVLRAPVEGAGPERIDEAKARAVAGVVKVVRLPYGVGVVAETPWAAFDAKRALAGAVTWTKTAKAWGFDSDKGLADFAAAARDLGQPSTDWFKAGDVRAALSQAARTMDATYLSDYAYHAQMEPLNAVASVSASGDAAEIWTGTQSPTTAQEATAKVLGISRDRVKLNYFLMGGGFGRRGPRDSDFTVDAVLLAKDAGRPVKVMWTREDDVAQRALPAAVGALSARRRRRIEPARRLAPSPCRRPGDAVLRSGALRSQQAPRRHPDGRHRACRLRRAQPAGRAALSGHRRAHRAAARHRLHRQQVRDRVLHGRSRGPARHRSAEVPARHAAPRTRARRRSSSAWRRWRTGAASARPAARSGITYIDYSGTQVAGIAEISVDRTSGQIAVHDFWCTIDCGIAVQPDNVVAQTESSIVYGLGVALSERITIKDGVVQQSNFYDYRVPRLNEVPAMHIELIASDNAPTGVGQMATPLVAPAIGNALARLASVRLRHAPFTPERVKAALG